MLFLNDGFVDVQSGKIPGMRGGTYRAEGLKPPPPQKVCKHPLPVPGTMTLPTHHQVKWSLVHSLASAGLVPGYN